MRKLLVALVLVSQLSFGAFAVVTHASAASANTNDVTTPTGKDTSGANLIAVCAVNYAVRSVGTLTDSQSNTGWNQLTSKATSLTQAVLFYKYNPTVGANHTFTYTSAVGYPAVAFIAVSGATSSPFDVENGNTQAAGTSVQIGSVTPSVANSFIAACLGYDANNAAPSIDSSFTVSDTSNYSSGVNFGVSMGYLIQSGGPSAVNPTWSWANSTDAAATDATFKPSGAAAAVTSGLSLLGAGAP